MDEPVSDTVRGILDGHIVLSRRFAQSYHFPAIDVLTSISRLSKRVSGPQTQKAAAEIRRLMALYAESEDMISVGAYQKGTNPELDKAIDLYPHIKRFLMQEETEKTSIGETLIAFGKLAGIEIPDEEYCDTAVPVAAGGQQLDEDASEAADAQPSTASAFGRL